ncbi:hypothetical protein HGRIS_012919 [Hohenbuehelia grisea]|uniref:Ribosomal protein mS38 C-terminal domain-containing protein n=1 Tax=Hohenbuehelia grisea TaxID=104357 RepID=A0ABR3IU50_9AGAR
MSSLPRLLRHWHVGRRAYSSFSSSKPGGGRYFNSSKPPKTPVVAANGTKGDTSSNANASAVPDSSEGTQHALNKTGLSNPDRTALMQAVDVEGSGASDTLASQADAPQPNAPSAAFIHHLAHPPHPIINIKEFNLHQFFSLHRPLVLLSHPPSILQPAPSAGPLFAAPAAPSDADLQPPPQVGLHGVVSEDNAASFVDADAETARQLMRTLTLNQAGASLAWQETMERLGVEAEINVSEREQMEQEWNEVMMDSTRRKRRKKMKKHKLKKRRRATRASRIKIGR